MQTDTFSACFIKHFLHNVAFLSQNKVRIYFAISINQQQFKPKSRHME